MKGKFVKINGITFYKVPISDSSNINETLGRVKIKNDGRYNWFRFRSMFHKDWLIEEQQGTCNTLEEATKKLLQGWANVGSNLT